MKQNSLILLAEDDPQFRRLYSDVLTSRGYVVLAAADGIEALQLLSVATPRLLILDIMMPKLDGIETCKRARRLIGEKTPVIFLSSLDGMHIVKGCVSAGGDDYLIKSSTMKTLIERVDRWMQIAPVTPLRDRRSDVLTSFAQVPEESEIALPGQAEVQEDAAPSRTDRNLRDALGFVLQALKRAGPDFGKAPEHKRRLVGYASSVLEYWLGSREAKSKEAREALQAILDATNILTPEESAAMAFDQSEFSQDIAYRLGRARGRHDCSVRHKQGPDNQPDGLVGEALEHDLRQWQRVLDEQDIA